jgi:cytochrome c2
MNENSKRFLAALAAASVGVALSSTAHATSYNAGSRSFQRMCPAHIAGDREFSGNGPDVTQLVDLKTDSSHRFAILDVWVNWKETKSNWTEAELDQELILGEAPVGRPFTHVWAKDASGAFAWKTWPALSFDMYLESWRDGGHSVNRFYPSDGADTGITKAWWISEFAVNGDTWGNDVGNCTDGDAYASVFLPAIWLWY